MKGYNNYIFNDRQAVLYDLIDFMSKLSNLNNVAQNRYTLKKCSLRAEIVPALKANQTSLCNGKF